MSVVLQPIYTQTVGAGGAATVVFNNIPQGYQDLRVHISVRSTATGSLTGGFADGANITLNSLGISGYSLNHLYANGTTYAGNFFVTPVVPYLGPINGGNSTAGVFSNIEVTIPNYTGGTNKQMLIDASVPTNSSSSFTSIINVLAHTKDPITSITFYPGEGNWAQHSTFTLYGISPIFDTANPGAPVIGTATDLGGVISVAFTRNDSTISGIPADGSGANNYSATSSPATSTFYGNTSPIIVTSPTVGQAYTFTVSANNSIWTSGTDPSNSVTTNNHYASIASTTVGAGGVSNIVFKNIPQYYKHLQMRVTARNTGANTSSPAYLQINNDGSSNYDFHYGQATGSGTPTGTPVLSATGSWVLDAPGTSTTSNIFGAAVIDILDYRLTSKYKVIRTISGYDANGSGLSNLYSGVYKNFAPVMSITFVPNGGNIAQNSVVSLYGIG